jgi:hypothetical protein
MKKILLFFVISLCFFQVQASAEITTEEQFSEEYILNHGYSQEMYRLMNLQHNQIVGNKSSLSEKEKIYKPWQNGVRRFLMYLDPALDDENFMRHDIKYTTRWDSL